MGCQAWKYQIRQLRALLRSEAPCFRANYLDFKSEGQLAAFCDSPVSSGPPSKMVLKIFPVPGLK